MSGKVATCLISFTWLTARLIWILALALRVEPMSYKHTTIKRTQQNYQTFVCGLKHIKYNSAKQNKKNTVVVIHTLLL